MTTQKVLKSFWVVSYQQGWGTRAARIFWNYYTSREPCKEEAVEILKENGWPATLEWFKPENSGLVTIKKINTEF